MHLQKKNSTFSVAMASFQSVQINNTVTLIQVIQLFNILLVGVRQQAKS